MSYVLVVTCSLDSDPTAGVGETAYVTATIGDQAGSPAAGSFILKTWQDDFVTAATDFADVVNWTAIGY